MLERSPKRPNETKERLLALAEAAVMAKGFAATSIEELIVAAGISKSGFFYHFKDKNALAKALILRYLDQDKVLVDDIFRRGDELNEDPLHGFLVGLRLFAELMSNLPANYPGCLAASFAYSDQLFDREVRELNTAERAAVAPALPGKTGSDRAEISAEAGGRPRVARRYGAGAGGRRPCHGPSAHRPHHPAAARPALPRPGAVHFFS